MGKVLFYQAQVKAINETPKNSGGPTHFEIYVQRVNSEGVFVGEEDLRVDPPSFMPFSITGGGTNTKPPIGAYCWVLEDTGSETRRGQIITYTPNPGMSAQGVFSNEETEEGSTIFKVGGLQKSVLRLAPKGHISLFSDEFSYFRIYGDNKHVMQGSKSIRIDYEGGMARYDYFKSHSAGNSDVTSYVQSFAQNSELRVASDREFVETEQTKKEMIIQPYVNKAVVKSGQILNVGQTGSDMYLSHLYQIDTRQAIHGPYKDTITTLRLGYQEAQKKYSTSDESAAGSLIEWSAKKASTTDSFSWIFRLGKLEDNDNNEKAKGEIFRNQIYSDVVIPISTPVIDPVGEGKGYNFIFENDEATEQYTESYGNFEDPEETRLKGSFWRRHLHLYTGHTLATVSLPTGLKLTEYYGGKNDKNENTFLFKKFTSTDMGKDKITLLETFDDKNGGLFTLERVDYPTPGADQNKTVSSFLFDKDETTLDRVYHGSQEAHERLHMEEDTFEVEVTPDSQLFYNIKMNGGKISIVIDDGSNKTEIISTPTELTVNAPDKVTINTKQSVVNSEDSVEVNTKDTTINSSDSVIINDGDVTINGGNVKVDGGTHEITSVIPGATPGHCALPICVLSGASHTGKTAGQ